jgi:hypothetical protein
MKPHCIRLMFAKPQENPAAFAFEKKARETTMDDEKRTIDNREVKHIIHIGDKEILYAENLSECRQDS